MLIIAILCIYNLYFLLYGVCTCMHLNSCTLTLLSVAQSNSLAGLQMMHTKIPHTLCGIYIYYMYGRNMYAAQGGHSLVWLARPYDLIAEGVKVGWS